MPLRSAAHAACAPPPGRDPRGPDRLPPRSAGQRASSSTPRVADEGGAHDGRLRRRARPRSTSDVPPPAARSRRHRRQSSGVTSRPRTPGAPGTGGTARTSDAAPRQLPPIRLAARAIPVRQVRRNEQAEHQHDRQVREHRQQRRRSAAGAWPSSRQTPFPARGRKWRRTRHRAPAAGSAWPRAAAASPSSGSGIHSQIRRTAACRGSRANPASVPSRSSGSIVMSPRISSMNCEPAFCAAWPTEKKIADFVSECTVMCSSAAKFATGPPMPNANVMMPMCSIEE